MASQPPKGKILLNINDGQASITVSNPTKRNALSLQMWKDLNARVDEASADTTVRLITIQGDGPTFISGADISEFEETRADPEDAKAYEAINGAAFDAIRRSPKPTLSLIVGSCFGGGLGIAAACDIRLASANAKFSIPAAKLGLAYPVDAIDDVVALIGASDTKMMLYTASVMKADEAQHLGLVNAVFSEDRFAEQCEDLVHTMLSRAPLTQQAAKLAIAATRDRNRKTAAETAASRCFSSQDYREGWQAFLEKRTPNFQGH